MITNIDEVNSKEPVPRVCVF